MRIDGDLNPACREIFSQLMAHYNGNFAEGHEPRQRQATHLESEKDRVGIGTFQPKDEKNQDSTELTGDINYRKIAIFGSDSDPRAFNFDGEFNIANRGIIEFVEILKLDVAFLYDLLGATQEHKIKPKKFAQTDIDEVIIGHTNEAEYRKLLNNEFMEALRDRTVKIDIPYITRVTEEVKIYSKDYSAERVGKHIAPHTLYMAAMWAVSHSPRGAQKAKPHRAAKSQALRRQDLARVHPGQHQRACAKRPCARASTASPRATSRTRSPTPWSRRRTTAARSTRSWSSTSSKLASSTTRSSPARKSAAATTTCSAWCARVRRHRQKRGPARHLADEEAIAKLCANYIDNVKAYTQKEKVKNPYTGSGRRAG